MTHPDKTPPIPLACPACRTPLVALGPHRQVCPQDGRSYDCLDGIWRCLLPERQAYFARFIQEYETVRRGEGRGLPNPDYFRRLPYADLTQRRAGDWRIRRLSFQALLGLVKTLEPAAGRPLVALDLGAGNSWLAYRLAMRGHRTAAVDLSVDELDGLGARRFYDADFLSVQAEFERLPFPLGLADLAVFNASLHYATDTAAVLGEALRVLRPGGRLVILDTPVYHDPSSGEQMVRERQADFTRRYGFPSDALPSENFLTEARLAELAGALGLRWERRTPFYGVSWALRPLRAWLAGRREPARFQLIHARKPGGRG